VLTIRRRAGARFGQSVLAGAGRPAFWDVRGGTSDPWCRTVPRVERGELDDAVRGYIDAIDLAYRRLFDRVHDLILDVYPQADVALSYKMPTYTVGRRRIHVGVWRHGVSLYGWSKWTLTWPEFTNSRGVHRAVLKEGDEHRTRDVVDDRLSGFPG
jgi:hypothetical protein